MKEELQGRLVEILTSIQGAVGKASDFAAAELPDIAQSYIAYGRAYTTVIAALGLAMVLCGWLGGAHINKRVGDGYYEGIGYFVGGCSGLIGAFFLMINASQLMLVWFAPKVWLLKEIAGMLK